MAVITEAAIRELASIRGERTPITSCYLDVDGRRVARYLDLEQEVDRLLRGVRAQANGEPSVHADLQRIERLVRGGIDRSRTRGLAIFSCSAEDLWHVIELPVPVHNQLTINQAPSVGQLESLLREHQPVGVLMADRQRARMFVFALGELVEHSERFDALPRAEGARGERDRGGDHPQHLAAKVDQHLRHAAQVAFDVWQSNRFDHLVIAVPDDLANTLDGNLHPYLRERLAGRASLALSASDDQVLAEAQAMETAVERKRQAAVVERLRAEAASGRRGVTGLGPTLAALNDHRIDQLVVSKGFSAPGWRCDDCLIHVALGRACKRCGGEMEKIDDVVEEAVEAALARSTRVEICIENADLDVMGRIGALLRF